MTGLWFNDMDYIIEGTNLCLFLLVIVVYLIYNILVSLYLFILVLQLRNKYRIGGKSLPRILPITLHTNWYTILLSTYLLWTKITIINYRLLVNLCPRLFNIYSVLLRLRFAFFLYRVYCVLVTAVIVWVWGIRM